MGNLKIESKKKTKMGIRKVGHTGASGEIEKMAKSKARKWPEEKDLLDKCDGLATPAGSESEHDRVTMYSAEARLNQFGREVPSADRRCSASRCCVMQQDVMKLHCRLSNSDH